MNSKSSYFLLLYGLIITVHCYICTYAIKSIFVLISIQLVQKSKNRQTKPHHCHHSMMSPMDVMIESCHDSMSLLNGDNTPISIPCF